MRTASAPRQKKAVATAVAPIAAGGDGDLVSLTRGQLDGARQTFLEALPIAAAVMRIDAAGGAAIETANAAFHDLVRWDDPSGPFGGENWLSTGPLADRLRRFLDSGDDALEFASDDGRQIGARHFTIRFASLNPMEKADRRVLLSIIDKTAQVETETSLRAEMLRDTLTGLPNRLALNERVEAILEHADFAEGSHAVVVIDIRRFARVNECMGAIAGDELLITFARRLYSALRAGDVLARTGSDEFGVLMRLSNGIEDAQQLAERVEAVLAAPFRLSELEIRVDCSIGCALIGGDVDLAEEVLRNAQFAVKRAKETGRSEIYEPHQASAARRRFSIETELRRAIEGDELTLAFQPLIDLPTGAVSGFEALARWHHAERGAIAPTEFIAVAEESGLIMPLGRWALDAAAQTLAQWDRTAGRTLPLYVAVNLSPIQVARDDVAAAVASALAKSGLAGHRLTLELTESAIVQDPARAAVVLAALKSLDVRVAMDDFGTGYTSLAYLQRLPIDILKIDRSFVTAVLKDRDSAAIIRAILSLAEALGMATTAEGIESEELANALSALGCSHGQGFFFSRPLPADQALAYWLARNA